MTRRAMPNADAAWLHMDRPTNRMVINAVLWFDEPIDAELLRGVLYERLGERFPSFRQIAVEHGRLGGVDWVDDPAFDLERHVHRVALPAPGDRSALQALVADIASTPLDRDKPLWDAYVIEGYGAGSALLLRMHHCIADGIVLARVMLSLADDAAPEGEVLHPPDHPSDIPLLPGALQPLARTVRTLSSALVHESAHMLVHPRRVAEELADDGRAAAKLLLSPSDPATAIHAELTPVARVAWSEPFALDAVKAIAHAHGATVNDVLVAAVAGALRRHLGEPDPLAGEVHAMVPFNLRPLDEPLPAQLGNRFGLVLLGLPTWIDDPLERLHAVRERMVAIKSSREGQVAFGMLSAMGVAPPAVEDRLIDFFSAKASLVLTNVPGPRAPVAVAGARVAGVLVWAPCAGDIAMSVSIFSYAGDVSVGFLVDAGLVPDPQQLVAHLGDELAALGAR
jgi:diacylglycerol O-acyltransferase